MADNLGDRMKAYEGYTTYSLMPLLPTLCRLDGRMFHSFTKGMNRPFDERLMACMAATTKFLVEETGASVGYTQSDEITLAWYSDNPKSQIWFDGKHSKMVSQSAALATLHFGYQVAAHLGETYVQRRPTFDSRVWQVPNLTEAANVFVWREWDATKNSISMVAHKYFSDKKLYGKNSSERQEMLFTEKGINWNDFSTDKKRGVYFQRKKVERAFTAEELESLPEKHEARRNPDLQVVRSDTLPLDMPPITQVVNREAVLFQGAEPITMQEGGEDD